MSATIPSPAKSAVAARIGAYIEEHQHRRQGNKILHGYPPPLLWRRRDVPVADLMVRSRDGGRRVSKRLNLYVATPYCLPTEPDRCGFCLFPSEIYRSRAQLDSYLGYLEREGRLAGEHLAGVELAAVYFGGGTANLYLPDQYHRLMDAVRAVFGPIAPAIEVTLEGIPQLFSRQKLQAMREAGINRVSIGAQQLSDDLIALSGRRQTATQVFRAIEWCQELGLPASVDLIFGWPHQTVERMLADLEAVVATGIAHLTHYELNVAGRTPFAIEHASALPSRRENLEIYRRAKGFLEAAGYRQRTAYDWEKPQTETSAEYRFESGWHRPLARDAAGRVSGLDMWGWGFAGVSSFLGTPEEPGWTYLNHTRVEGYFRGLDEGHFPVERGYRYGRRELRLNVLFQGLHAMAIDLAAYQQVFGIELLEEHAAAWAALAARGWVTVSDGRLTVVGDGVFHTPLIQSVLAKPPGFFVRLAS